MHRTLRSFELLEPKTIEEAVHILSTHIGKAKVFAGGVDLVARMRRRQIKPECVVSIRMIPELDYIEGSGASGLRIGALTTLRSIELSPVIQQDYVLLYEAVHQIASIQVKTMSTAVGNLCVATPASDVAPALYVLGAELKIVGPALEKTTPIENFFVEVGQTILEPNQIVTEILIPGIPAGAGVAFLKLGKTKDDIAKVNVAVLVTVTNGTCKEAKIALGSVAPTVIRAPRAEEILKSEKLNEKTTARAAEAAAEALKPITDVRSTAVYRKEMVKVLVKDALEKAATRTKV